MKKNVSLWISALLVLALILSFSGMAFAQEAEPSATATTEAEPSATVSAELSSEPSPGQGASATAEVKQPPQENDPFFATAAFAAPASVPVPLATPDFELDDTTKSALEPFFPDSRFLDAVFDALIDEGHTQGYGATQDDAIKDMLSTYTGDIIAKNKSITNVSGLNLLRNAGTIDLSGNNISDWTVLSPGGAFSKDHYGSYATNVNWEITKNPFRLLPADFGGRLIIEQMATKGLTYPEDQAKKEYRFIRSSAVQKFSMDMDIGRCTILGTSEDNDFITDGLVKIKVVNVSKMSLDPDLAPLHPAITAELLKMPEVATLNQWVRVGNILLNENLLVGIGTDEVIHDWTADEFNTITEGSVSFKYYLKPTVTIYDRVKLVHNNTGSASITKTDSKTGEPLRGAIYSLYKDDVEVMSGLETDWDGKVFARGLTPGSYSFREMQAPEGYQLNSKPVSFTVSDPVNAHGTIAGGYQTVTDSAGNDATAGFDELFIAGNGTPDMTLDVTPKDSPKSILVTYSSLAVRDGERKPGQPDSVPVTRTFTTDQAAMDDINAMKNENLIAGPITIDVEYSTFSSTAQTNDPMPPDEPSASPSVPATPTPSASVPADPQPSVSMPTDPQSSPAPGALETKSPRTDDSSSMVLFLIMGITALGAICIAAIKRKRIA